MTRKVTAQQGFTFPEMVITMAVAATLFGIVILNLTTAKSKTDMSATVNTLIADFKQQQLKAMIGDTEGRGTESNYGIHFNAGTYETFNGTYVANAASSSKFSLGDSIQVVNAGYDVIFSQVSGEVIGYSSAANTITLRNTTSTQQKVIQFNRYGVITSVN